jgi:membrane dipeptidase
MAADPPRLIDLHTDWLLQYAPETDLYNPEMAAHAAKALPQAEGYLGATSAAVLAVYRDAEDWARRPDPWAALGDLIARIEAEFPGRLLIGADDLARWRDDPHGLAWGIVGIEGFDALIRCVGDLGRLPALFDRGARVFQPVYSSTSLLAGSAADGDDRGLLDLGRAFLDVVLGLSTGGPRPILDLAHLNPSAASDVLAWFEEDEARPGRVIPVYSHGAVVHEGFASPRAITVENLRRLRALGGVIGFTPAPPFYGSPELLKRSIEETAAIPYSGRAGFEGIAVGTDFLGVDQTLPGMGNAPEVVDWVASTFEAAAARAILRGNGEAMIERMIGP